MKKTSKIKLIFSISIHDQFLFSNDQEAIKSLIEELNIFDILDSRIFRKIISIPRDDLTELKNQTYLDIPDLFGILKNALSQGLEPKYFYVELASTLLNCGRPDN